MSKATPQFVAHLLKLLNPASPLPRDYPLLSPSHLRSPTSSASLLPLQHALIHVLKLLAVVDASQSSDLQFEDCVSILPDLSYHRLQFYQASLPIMNERSEDEIEEEEDDDNQGVYKRRIYYRLRKSSRRFVNSLV